MPPKASVIVPVFNGEHVIRKQLDALRRQSCARDLEVIVVDDGSSDSTADVIETWISDVGGAGFRLVRRDARGGPNAARNAGILSAQSELVLFCDGDDEVDAQWAALMIEAFTPGSILAGPYRRLGGDPDDPRDWFFRTATAFGWAIAVGGNLGVGRSLAVSVGGFDEAIVQGGTEVEFCIRAQLRANATVKRVPDAVVYHRCPESAKGRYSQAFKRERGHAYIERRYDEGVITHRGTKGFVIAAKRVVWSLTRGRRAPYPHDFFTSLGRFVGLCCWAVPSRLDRTEPRLLTVGTESAPSSER